MEENAESKELQLKKLEATVSSLSEELIKVCGTDTPPPSELDCVVWESDSL